MALEKIAKNEGLIKNIMQSLAYFSFMGAYLRLGFPEVQGKVALIVPFISIFLGMMLVTYIFTIAHVLRPVVQTYFPEFKIRRIDEDYQHIPAFHPSNILFTCLFLAFVGIGLFVVGFGVNV
ncbi:hypothetical protein [Agarivorans sp. Z349TD_8]|uniref:hypothetical protein n=1 Tax=Agarivorans sp. Z349TD_8 TaxID=3421434 RepID=UPI003D7CDE95